MKVPVICPFCKRETPVDYEEKFSGSIVFECVKCTSLFTVVIGKGYVLMPKVVGASNGLESAAE
jgi:transposase-like protein